MITRPFRRPSTSDALGGPIPPILARLLMVIALFVIAFAVDVVSGRQFSQLLGSTAIFGSVLVLFPAIRPGVVAASVYALTWIAFNVARAFADTAGLAIGDLSTVSDVERSLFGGTLPVTMLQRSLFDPDHVRPHDFALAMVHVSFFLLPFLIATIAWRRHRLVFRRYLAATAICFALSLVAFVLLPTAPPWQSDPDEVIRITHHIVREFSGSGPGANTAEATASSAAFGFEPNDVAALPSVHVAMAVLVSLVLGGMAVRWSKVLGACYALAMSLAVIYLGEHFVLDVILGWVVALIAWSMSRPKPR